MELIAQVRSGVAQINLERHRERIGAGSGFLVERGLVTNCHNIERRKIGAVSIRFADTEADAPDSYIRLIAHDCTVASSPEDLKDYACLELESSDFEGRHVFEFCDSDNPLSVGEQIVFLGFPFGMPQMTAHVGYVSSIHERNGIEIIQIDGSVNGGNSGGPLVDPKTGRVAGIVTRAVTGLVEEQFNRLIDALQSNEALLRQRMGGISFGGVDLVEALAVSQAAMGQIARDLKRSANVGIGYAYSARYVRDRLAKRGE